MPEWRRNLRSYCSIWNLVLQFFFLGYEPMTPGQGFNFLTGPKDFTWGPWKPETLEGSPIGVRRTGNSQWEKPSSSSPLVNINWRNNNSVFRTESLHLKRVWIPVLDFSVVWESQTEKIICLKPEKPLGLPAVANSNHHEDGGSFPCVMRLFFFKSWVNILQKLFVL